MLLNYKTERKPVLRRMRVTPLDLCLRVIVNEKPYNLEKTISSDLSVLLLIYEPCVFNSGWKLKNISDLNNL